MAIQKVPVYLLSFWLIFSQLACTEVHDADGSKIFQHNVAGTAEPWTHERFDAGGDKFTFAVFSDLTGGERERVFEIAVAQLSLLRPELIINVGDLIDGGTVDLGEIEDQWDSFDERASMSIESMIRQVYRT